MRELFSKRNRRRYRVYVVLGLIGYVFYRFSGQSNASEILASLSYEMLGGAIAFLFIGMFWEDVEAKKNQEELQTQLGRVDSTVGNLRGEVAALKEQVGQLTQALERQQARPSLWNGL